MNWLELCDTCVLLSLVTITILDEDGPNFFDNIRIPRLKGEKRVLQLCSFPATLF